MYGLFLFVVIVIINIVALWFHDSISHASLAKDKVISIKNIITILFIVSYYDTETLV